MSGNVKGSEREKSEGWENVKSLQGRKLGGCGNVKSLEGKKFGGCGNAKRLEGEKCGGEKFGGSFWRFLRTQFATFRVSPPLRVW